MGSLTNQSAIDHLARAAAASALSNMVDLSTNQIISGIKDFQDAVTLTGGISGTPSGIAAGVGIVGEVLSSEVLIGAAVPLVGSVSKTVVSREFPAGDWDIFGFVGQIGNGATTLQSVVGSISLVDNTRNDSNTALERYSNEIFGAGASIRVTAPMTPFQFAVPTFVYLIAQAEFTTGTQSAFGRLTGRRVR